MISRASKARFGPDRCQVMSSSFVLVARYDNRAGRKDVPRPRKLNFHSLSDGANRERGPSPTTVEDKEALLRRGERWKLRSARAEIGKDAKVFSLACRTAKTTTLYPRNSDYYRSGRLSSRISLLSSPYNGLKCTCQRVNTLIACAVRFFLRDFTNALVMTSSLL